MRLKGFQVWHYRSVKDSGWIDVTQRTAMVGRNESGKTSLLLALESLNPPDRELVPLSYVKDFPRDRPRTEFSEDLEVVNSLWELSPAERQEIGKLFPRAKDVTQVKVARQYKAQHLVRLVDLPALTVNHDDVQTSFGTVQRSVIASFRGKDAAATAPTKTALEKLASQLMGVAGEKATDWAGRAGSALAAFRQSLASANHALPDTAAEQLSRVEALVKQTMADNDAWAQARKWVVEHLPVFVYLAEYPELEGHQNIPEYVQRLQQKRLTEADVNFGKLMKVAGLDPTELNNLLSTGDHEQRQQLANRAGAVVTAKVRELWKDRRLKIRFNLDAQHFDTFVSDPESVYDIEINLNERSRGLKWFFSFYVTFAADTAAGPAEDAVLLFDEPALYLHAVAQQDLLDHFKQDFTNTIIYTTHSPFMVPIDDLPSVRTVNISVATGTTVTNDPTGDSKTLFPLQTALGYFLTQTLFIGPKNLVVEGVSDFWYASSVSESIAERGGAGLPQDLVLTPAGGAQKIPYMVSLLTSHRLKVVVLMDSESQSRRTAQDDLIKNKLIREEGIIFVSEALGSGTAGEADIEDLLDPAVYGKLVQDTYKTELAGKTLKLNPNIPRIVRRYEEAFAEHGLTFNKTRPARLFLRRIAEAPDEVLPPASRAKFETLFGAVRERLGKVVQRETTPFR